MSKCKTVQDEKKINEMVVRLKSEGKIIEKKVILSSKNDTVKQPITTNKS